jgi:hypothetical protein
MRYDMAGESLIEKLEALRQRYIDGNYKPEADGVRGAIAIVRQHFAEPPQDVVTKAICDAAGDCNKSRTSVVGSPAVFAQAAIAAMGDGRRR